MFLEKNSVSFTNLIFFDPVQLLQFQLYGGNHPVELHQCAVVYLLIKSRPRTCFLVAFLHKALEFKGLMVTPHKWSHVVSLDKQIKGQSPA